MFLFVSVLNLATQLSLDECLRIEWPKRADVTPVNIPNGYVPVSNEIK